MNIVLLQTFYTAFGPWVLKKRTQMIEDLPQLKLLKSADSVLPFCLPVYLFKRLIHKGTVVQS